MSKTNQTIRDILDHLVYGSDNLFSSAAEGKYVEIELNKIKNQALKEISELLLDCKPDKKNTRKGRYADSFGNGYNAGLDDYEKNIKARL